MRRQRPLQKVGSAADAARMLIEDISDNGIMIGLGPGGIRVWVPSDDEATEHAEGKSVLTDLLGIFARKK